MFKNTTTQDEARERKLDRQHRLKYGALILALLSVYPMLAMRSEPKPMEERVREQCERKFDATERDRILNCRLVLEKRYNLEKSGALRAAEIEGIVRSYQFSLEAR